MDIVNKAYSQKYESCGKSFSGAGELKKHTHDDIHNGENDQNDFKLQFLGNILPWSTRGKNSLLCPETR